MSENLFFFFMLKPVKILSIDISLYLANNYVPVMVINSISYACLIKRIQKQSMNSIRTVPFTLYEMLHYMIVLLSY